MEQKGTVQLWDPTPSAQSHSLPRSCLRGDGPAFLYTCPQLGPPRCVLKDGEEESSKRQRAGCTQVAGDKSPDGDRGMIQVMNEGCSLSRC